MKKKSWMTITGSVLYGAICLIEAKGMIDKATADGLRGLAATLFGIGIRRAIGNLEGKNEPTDSNTGKATE